MVYFSVWQQTAVLKFFRFFVFLYLADFPSLNQSFL